MTVIRWAVAMVALAAAGCSKKASEAPATAEKTAQSTVAKTDEPTLGQLPAGPVPVALPKVAAAEVRAIKTTDAFLVIAADGSRHYGRAAVGDAPYAGMPLVRGDSAFGHLFMDGSSEHWYAAEGEVNQDLDAYAELSTAAKTNVIILADAATPARVTIGRWGIENFGYRAIALAANAANTAVPYDFGGEPWSEPAELMYRVAEIADLGKAQPASVLLQITDADTTAALVGALAVLGRAGVKRVRVHRMMGWGQIPVENIVSVRGPTADDDEITDGDAATVAVAEPVVRGGLSAYGTGAALSAMQPRFRYCFEKRRAPKLRGKIQLELDVAADGTISHVKASGLDAKIASCVAGAVFDLDITPAAIEAAGHVSVAVSFNVAAPAATADPEEKVSGWWCLSIEGAGVCARYEAQCDAARSGALQVAGAMKGEMSVTECTQQATAWTANNKDYFPTQKECGRKCRAVK
jgi:hypothetical protein